MYFYRVRISMKTITFVTGNPNKLAEARAILPFEIESAKLDLTEIQSMDVREVVRHKLHEAYEKVGKPVMVDDVSAGLESMNGFPGPFIKFAEETLGEGALYKLSKVENDQAKIICCLGYFAGDKEIIVEGIVHGTVVSPRGDYGWGFDYVIVPDGQTQTWAELGTEIKNQTSHRHAALTQMTEKLQAL
jgi:non-canonical purine NTP pyrophosphatase (RdgB/HAM1 family)